MDALSNTAAVAQPISGALVNGRIARLERAESQNQDETVAREVEGLFAQLFVKELRRGLGEGFFGQGAGADTFEGWLDEHLADSLARDGVLDLAGKIKTDLERKRAGQAAAEEELLAQEAAEGAALHRDSASAARSYMGAGRSEDGR